MAAFFRNLKESMIDSCEQMIRVFEEGTSILLGLAQNKTEDDSTFPDESFTDDQPMHDDSLVIGEDEAVDNMKSPLDGITEDVLSDIMSNQAKPLSAKDSFDAFRSAITWNEPFIMGLIAFHIVTFLTTLYVTRRCGMWSRMIFLTVLAGIVRSAERLNDYGAQNWESFATQNYFDKSGIFISIMISAPLLLMAFYMLISYLREAAGLLVKVKKQELRAKKRNRRNKGEKIIKLKTGKKKDD